MAATVPTLDTERIRDANIRYHDAAARGYDSKWAIDFGEIGARPGAGQAVEGPGPATGPLRPRTRDRRRHGLLQPEPGASGGDRAARSPRTSPRACSSALPRRPQELGVDVDTRQADAESLPFPDDSFDLVLGHAVLHHLPGLDKALSEFHRVLAPGGTLAFMGEPSAHGDRLAAMPKRLGALRRAGVAPRRCAPPRRGSAGSAAARRAHLRLARGARRRAHLHSGRPACARARRRLHRRARLGEELLANVYGWFLRRLESDVDADDRAAAPGTGSRSAATSRSSGSTASCSSRGSRQSLFYNLLISGRRRPGPPGTRRLAAYPPTPRLAADGTRRA